MARILAMVLSCWVVLCPGAAQNIAAPAQAAANIAGKIDLLEGNVTVYDRAKARRKVSVGDALYEGDGVVTGRDGELHVAMDDGGYLAVRPNTTMSVLAYQAQGRDDDRSILSLAAGSFRSITGWSQTSAGSGPRSAIRRVCVPTISASAAPMSCCCRVAMKRCATAAGRKPNMSTSPSASPARA